MDGLDVYIDDYSKPDPIDAETVARLVQSRYLFDPPKTRVNEHGEVEDVPVDDATGPVIAADAPADAAAPAAPEPTTLASPEPTMLVPGDPDAPASSAAARPADKRETDR
jgi:hypothetical protein